ncbi:low-specificity L-threonine aldolase [Congregibacter litoralis]|uniref:L-threonine aldolase n=1 Tax=Congregibacter litoralis KT71 TaxID=314285 RepID=A4AAT9_9GAMM|nr:low-specificity L-threonine aldolase [Congregibacter litoralis]EAQ96811.1 L-threonine aldolase [Congregibacter litoralis KT71]
MIDLRSDTVTKPTRAMLEVMGEAETGDDVYGEDPTVNALERFAAALTGKEAAVFAPTGTQSNLLGLLSHCGRGHEYIVGHTAHTYMYEGGGAAVLGGIQPCPLPFAADGSLPLDAVEKAIKPDDAHFAITRLVCLENTQAGKVLPLDYLQRYSELTRQWGLKRHLDGARLFNAAVALDVPVAQICQYFDTVSICLSKGLACPVGSLLVGDEDAIRSARRWRKMLGGGMRQAGILAAAGLYALENNVQRLREDHDKARRVADALASLPAFTLQAAPQTNMVMLDAATDVESLARHLESDGIRTAGTRWVFHQDVSDDDVDRLIESCRRFR